MLVFCWLLSLGETDIGWVALEKSQEFRSFLPFEVSRCGSGLFLLPASFAKALKFQSSWMRERSLVCENVCSWFNGFPLGVGQMGMNPNSTLPQLQVLSNLGGADPPWTSFRWDLGVGKMLVITQAG